jgi:hypothetical protein
MDLNRLKDDDCYQVARNNSDGKKLRYYTTSFKDFLDAQTNKENYFGLTIKNELFVPTSKIDTYSDLVNGTNGQMLTNQYTKRGTDTSYPLPTIPAKYQLAHGNIEIEDNLRMVNNYKTQKSCLPIECNYNEKTFQIFEKNSPPQNIAQNVKLQVGVQTRF